MTWTARGIEPADLVDYFLSSRPIKTIPKIFRLAEERGILCNSVDDPEHCRFSFGSVHRQGDLSIAISTNGWAPALAVRLRQRLESEIGPEYGALLALLKKLDPSSQDGLAISPNGGISGTESSTPPYSRSSARDRDEQLPMRCESSSSKQYSNLTGADPPN